MTRTVPSRATRGPAAGGLLGDLAGYNADPLGYMTETARAYGEFVPLRFGPVRALLVTNPAAIEAILIAEHRHFRKARGLRALGTLLGNGLVISEGDFWLRQRRMMQPAFHRASVARYAEVMVRRIGEMLTQWQAGTTVDAVAEMRALTFLIAAESLFGADVTEDELADAREALETVEGHLQTRVSSLKMFIPDWVPTPGNRRTRAAVGRLDGLVHRIIEARRSEPGEHEDLLALLLRATEDGTGMSDRQLRDEVMTLLVAGHETTAFTLAWALVMFARHPEADAALRAEVASVLDGRQPSVEDIPHLTVTERVVHEVLRLYPAGYISGREAISDVEIEGHPIRKGTVVILPIWVMHRDPRFFDAPDEFQPERWADGLARRLPRGVYFPFGMGPRQCIGAPFAMQESVLVLASVLQRFRLETVEDGEVRPVPRVALQPERPIRLRLAEPLVAAPGAR